MSRTSIGKVLKSAELNESAIINPQSRKELADNVRSALNELNFALSGCSVTAYHSACAVEAGDTGWKEAGTLEEMATVCILAELLGFLQNAEESIKTVDFVENHLHKK